MPVLLADLRGTSELLVANEMRSPTYDMRRYLHLRDERNTETYDSLPHPDEELSAKEFYSWNRNT